MRQGMRWWLVAALVAASLTAGGIATARTTRTARPRHHGLSAARVRAAQSKSPARVIVLLRNQNKSLPPSPRLMRARRAAVASEQAPLQASVRSAGGRITHSFHAVNAFSAVVTPAERSRLAADRSVAAVLPDSWVPAPAPTGSPAGSAGTASVSPKARSHSTPGTAGPAAGVTAPDGQQICPSDPAKPIVAPEGLSLIDAPQAQQMVDGAGVKVAFIAEGIDVDNPDFIRPDGSHVIVDYRDFTGQGLNAPTTGAEAFGDASSIAAQGQVPHDLSKFVNASHPLPPGCNIVLKGVSPGASLVAMKVFPTYNGVGSGAYTSTIIQGMDWAVSVDHVNVLNESFGGDDLPDTFQDVTKQFNTLAEQAGTVVTISSGDQGTANTIGSPASGPSGIVAGATTQFQGLAQTTRGGYQLSPKGWLNDNIAAFSSSGFTQEGKTIDLVAPGNESYEACTKNTAQYSSCKNLNGQPSDLSTFGGTSESAPLTAGVAALVIQAYRQTHGGDTPSPQLVKQLIVSNADDLNIPSDEQGAGNLNALAAVQAAETYGTSSSSAAGNGRLVSPSQLDLAPTAGSATGGDVTVTNDGAGPETINARLRSLATTLSDHRGQVTLNPGADPTYLDYKGVTQAYTKMTFTVPANADRLDGAIAWPGPKSTVNMTLFDPSGKMAAFTYQSNGETPDYGNIDVRNPAAGTWTAVFSTPVTDNAYSGAVNYDLTTQRFDTTGSVTPSTVTLSPGQSATLHVALTAPSTPGDYSRDLELSGTDGKTTVVPVVVRSLVPLQGGSGSFSGAITGGDGDGILARTDTFGFDVPSGARAVNVQFNLPSDPNTTIQAFLVSPDGQAVAQELPAEDNTGHEAMQLYQRNPQPGRWLVTFATFSPVGGTTTSGPFHGTVSLHAVPVSVAGVPRGRAAVRAGSTRTARVRVTNTGNAPMSVFIDPRRTDRTYYNLLSITPATGVSLPINVSTTPPPEFLVPTETNLLLGAAQATAPITFDWGFEDPDLESTTNGTTATAQFSATEVTPGVWPLIPSLIGPFTGPGSATANTGIVARSRVFDRTVTSSTGDQELDYVDPSAPAATPVTINPGQTKTITVRFTAPAQRGSRDSGDLIVDDNFAPGGSANEITAIPYSYRVR